MRLFTVYCISLKSLAETLCVCDGVRFTYSRGPSGTCVIWANRTLFLYIYLLLHVVLM